MLLQFHSPKFFYVAVIMMAMQLFSVNVLKAQSLGDPVVKITFGSGTATRGPALAADSGSTTYTYTNGGNIAENAYTITNLVNTNVHGGFVTSYDHDYETNGGQTTGYMMVVNGNITAGEVFTRTVPGLCGNTQYQFGVWIKNVLSQAGAIPPNMVFHVYADDGTTELGSSSTGDVPTGNVCHNYTANFTLPAGTSSVIIKLVSNASGTVGNDFAVDDITFSPYGAQTVTSTFSSTSSAAANTCAGSSQNITLNSTVTPAYANPYYQWQVSSTSSTTGYVNISGANGASYTFAPPSTSGTYYYRVLSAEMANASSSSCQVASKISTLTVTAAPVADFSYTPAVCLNDPITFTDLTNTNGSAITSEVWNFGDGSATSATASHTYTAPGTYTATLTVTSNTGCISVATKTVVINTKPVAAFTVSTPNCAGQPVLFTDNSTNTDGTITQWIWSYGDGTTETLTSGTAHTHVYTAGGDYTATLTVILAAGCSSTAAIRTVSITALPTITATFTSNSTALETGCTNATKSLTLSSAVTLAYTSPVYQWQVDNGSGFVNIQGATTATYTFATTTTTGTYNYRVIAYDAAYNANYCSATSSVATLTITAPPATSFTYTPATCLKDSVNFTDNSTSAVAITAWAWDFGDGTTSTLQNPSHFYSAPGNYVVREAVTNSAGCSTVSTTQTVHINANPLAAFTFSSPDCAAQAITFTDASTAADGTIAQWIWDYGDGSTETLTSATAHTHTYIAAGTYAVSLTVVTATGCSSTILTKSVTINPLAVVNFTLPDVCLADAFAQFTDNSTISDGTQAGFTYLWDFGDANATTANPNTSTTQNPRHKYTKAALYTVALTVTTANGCSTTKTQNLNVNGENPVASFTPSSTSVCSDQTVLFTDNSYVADFGNITKLIWYFDYDNNPSVSEQYTDPTKGTTYPHVYPAFYYPTANKKYHVVLKAYSGGTCVNITDSYITSLPVPVIVFDALTPVCINAGTVQITGKESTGISGTTSYSGTGVTSAGIFDPTIAGVGTTNITYTFTATDGCAESLVQPVTVYPVPTLSSSAKLTVLDGGSITLDAKLTGDSTGITYQWSPAAGLNNSTLLNPTANPTDDTQYLLTATTKAGCTVTTSTLVKVLKAPIVPNTFTPNGDGVNDLWNIEYLSSYLKAQVDVYNRFGSKVFTSIGYATPWDGTFQGANLPVGVYYYIIDPKNGRKAISGYVTIIR